MDGRVPLSGPGGAPVSPLPPALDGLGDLRPVPLEEVNARAALVARACRTYLVPTRLVHAVFAGAASRYGVLTIGGRGSFLYSSTYLDTPGLDTFHDHRQRRRLRYKVRVRTYVDTRTRMCEVKLKGARGGTDKRRAELPGPPDRLTERDRAFVDGTLRGYGLEPPEDLVPSAVTDYRRTTLVADSGAERVTLDTDLVGYRGGRSVRTRPDAVLVEVKTRGGLTATERRLHEHGLREVGFSKYAAVLTALEPGLRGNRWHRAMRDCLEPGVDAPERSEAG
ncbi:polyphosphate polymerase domain-containing protein [Nocardiopsis lucentensis]|uniref:polyphosphate polymerase domain-containing protein n=1 Tax=Nocardiopsis lucentensis TaxID=53441 RepID=UPI000346EF9E